MRLFARDYYASLAAHSAARRRSRRRDAASSIWPASATRAMDIVEMPGQFTRRGGILDVYSPEMDRPVRIEFFGDEIESIRKFDPETQRSSAPAR